MHLIHSEWFIGHYKNKGPPNLADRVCSCIHYIGLAQETRQVIVGALYTP